MTNPLGSLSVGLGHGRMPAPLFHCAEQAFSQKSYPISVTVPPDTLISTQKGESAFLPMPNKALEELRRIQKPRYSPSEAGATIFTVRSTVCPGLTAQGKLIEVGAPI